MPYCPAGLPKWALTLVAHLDFRILLRIGELLRIVESITLVGERRDWLNEPALVHCPLPIVGFFDRVAHLTFGFSFHSLLLICNGKGTGGSTQTVQRIIVNR